MRPFRIPPAFSVGSRVAQSVHMLPPRALAPTHRGIDLFICARPDITSYLLQSSKLES